MHMTDVESTSSAPQQQLPAALQLHILSLLPPNDRALSGRLVSPDAAAGLSQDPTCTASLSQPLPPHAVPWAVEAGRQHVRQLPFRHKLQLLSTAAASGSEVNLDVALALLQPSVFPGKRAAWAAARADPSVAAVTAGHPQLLTWMLRQHTDLVDRDAVLEEAARHRDLAGLQATWEVLVSESIFNHWLDQWALDAAAGSATPDAVAKMEWALEVGANPLCLEWRPPEDSDEEEGHGPSCRLQEGTAAAAARSGDLGRLRWLRERGCPMGQGALESALQHADLAVAQWLVDEAGVELPAPATGPEFSGWHRLLEAAVQSSDGVAKLEWLRERGGPALSRDSDRGLRGSLVVKATAAGQVEVVQHLAALVGLDAARPEKLADAAVASGSIPVAEWLRQAGVAFRDTACREAMRAGRVGMVRWLACVAGVSTSGMLVDNFERMVGGAPYDTPADSRDLLEAVQLVAGAGFRNWNAEGGSYGCGVEIAAGRGHLALVQYLLQRMPSFRVTGRIVAAAAEGGCEALVEWLVEQHPGCLEGAGAGESPYVPAARNGDLGTLTALRRLGVPWGAGDVVTQAVEEGAELPALRWLVEQGAPVGSREQVQSARRCAELRANHSGMDVVAWLGSLGAAAATAAGKPV